MGKWKMVGRALVRQLGPGDGLAEMSTTWLLFSSAAGKSKTCRPRRHIEHSPPPFISPMVPSWIRSQKGQARLVFGVVLWAMGNDQAPDWALPMSVLCLARIGARRGFFYLQTRLRGATSIRGRVHPHKTPPKGPPACLPRPSVVFGEKHRRGLGRSQRQARMDAGRARSPPHGGNHFLDGLLFVVEIGNTALQGVLSKCLT